MDKDNLHSYLNELMTQRDDALRDLGKTEGAIELCKFLIKKIEEGDEISPSKKQVNNGELDSNTVD